MKKQFILFLKKKGVYALYRKNISSITRKVIENGYIPYNIIGLTVAWSKTKEGHDFWENLDTKWMITRLRLNKGIIPRNMKDFYHYI